MSGMQGRRPRAGWERWGGRSGGEDEVVGRMEWWGGRSGPQNGATAPATPPCHSPGSEPHGPGNLLLALTPPLCGSRKRTTAARGALGTPVLQEDGRRAFCFHALSNSLRRNPFPVRGPLEAAPEPRPGSWRLLGRNPVPAWLRLGFAPAKQEMRCSRSTSLLRNSSAGVFLKSPHPQSQLWFWLKCGLLPFIL